MRIRRKKITNHWPEEDKWLDEHFSRIAKERGVERVAPAGEGLRIAPNKPKQRKAKKKNSKRKPNRAYLLALKWPYCYWCGKCLKPDEATVEHIIRQADGGADGPENIGVSCSRYNSGRHDGAKRCQEPNELAGFRNEDDWWKSRV
jgi:hypothetical protein